jgi:phosphonate metabolism transcriptional regulator PhnF
MGIIKSSRVSLHKQLSSLLRREIEEGVYPAGGRVPGEMELSRQYGLNRHTVRAALQELVQEDLIYRLQGKGTFVTMRRVPYAVARETYFSESMRQAGLSSKAQLLDAYEQHADEAVAARLEVPVGGPILVLEILRFIKDVPVCYAVTRLQADAFPGLRDHLKEPFSLYGVLREVYGVHARRDRAAIEAVSPTASDQDLLRIPRGVPILVIKTLARAPDGRPVEFSVSRSRADSYSLEVDFGEMERRMYEKARQDLGIATTPGEEDAEQ